MRHSSAHEATFERVHRVIFISNLGKLAGAWSNFHRGAIFRVPHWWSFDDSIIGAAELPDQMEPRKHKLLRSARQHNGEIFVLRAT